MNEIFFHEWNIFSWMKYFFMNEIFFHIYILFSYFIYIASEIFFRSARPGPRGCWWRRWGQRLWSWATRRPPSWGWRKIPSWLPSATCWRGFGPTVCKPNRWGKVCKPNRWGKVCKPNRWGKVCKPNRWGIFNTVPVSWIQHSLKNFPLF